MENSPVREQSFAFAVRIVEMHKHLYRTYKEYVISKQVLRSGTAIGALVREAQMAESRPDFIHKISVGHKEAEETAYWLELLHATSYLTGSEFESMKTDCLSLQKMLASIRISTKKNT